MNAPLEGPEAALSTGIVPLLLMCGLLVWVVGTRAWAARDDKDYDIAPDMSDWRGGEHYARAVAQARSIAAHPSNSYNHHLPCRYCGQPADTRAGADVCIDLQCLRQAVADRKAAS
jgi:hypothetical protein